MRLIGDRILKDWGQPIIVENRPGGNMMIGGRACADAPNDGYTICILPIETLSYAPFLYKNVPYDPQKDFVPITNPFFNTQVLVVSAALEVKTLDELAALSKAKPRTLSYTVPSASLALFMDKWKAATGADLVRVPFRGGAEAVNGVLSGATPVAMFGLANLAALLRGGQVRGLAIDSAERSPLFPDVPTLRRARLRRRTRPASISASSRPPARRRRSSTSCATRSPRSATTPSSAASA